MNWKIVRRIILIFLLTGIALAYVGYRYGIFDNIIKGYQADLVTSASQSTQPDEGLTLQNSAGNANTPVKKEPEVIAKNNSVPGQSLVSIVQSDKSEAREIEYEEIKSMVQEAIDLSGGFEGVIRDNLTVVLKPNLVQMHVDSTGQPFDKELNGATTDWRVTRAVAQLVRQYDPNGRIYIMEGSGGDATKKTMEYLNYTKEKIPEADEFISIEEDSGAWQDFSSPGLIKYSLPYGLLHKEYYLNKKYSQCDVLISIPCLKTNSGTIVSGSIKNVSIGAAPANIYGVSATNPGRTRMVSHKIIDGDMDKWLYDYYMCKPVNFVVMDGLQGFQNGPVPIGKKNIISDRMNMRLVMAGRDAVAVDTIEALVMGWDPESIPYLDYLSKSGMGIMDTSKISVVGKLVDEVRKDFEIRFSNLGGVRIQNKKPPKLSILNLASDGADTHLTLDTGEGTTKVEVYVDGKLKSAFLPPVLDNITLNSAELTPGHEIRILSYDRFMNHAEAVPGSVSSMNGKAVDAEEYLSRKQGLLKAGDLEGLIRLNAEETSPDLSSYPAYYELPKGVIRLAHDKAMEKFNIKENQLAASYTKYGLDEYSKVFLNKPLTQITIDDITVKSGDKYADMKIPASEFILIFNNYAYFVLQSGDSVLAEQLLRKVTELAPTRAVAYIDLGNACWNLGKKDEAKIYYKKYLELLGKNTKNVPPEIYERIKD